MGTSMVRKKNSSNLAQSDHISGWGETGVNDTSTEELQENEVPTSTEKLQETVVPIVPSSKCVERMADAEDVDESLIVCTEGAGTGRGPCLVFVTVSWKDNLLFHSGGQWRAPYSSR